MKIKIGLGWLVVAYLAFGWDCWSIAQNATEPNLRKEWQLSIDWTPKEASLDVSRDRKFAIVCVSKDSGQDREHACVLLDLLNGTVTNQDDFLGVEIAKVIGVPHRFAFSSDGSHALFESGNNAAVLDLRLNKAKIFRVPKYASVIWAGNRLLVSTSDGNAVEAFDASGQLIEKLKLHAYVFASDPTGSKLLAYAQKEDPTAKQGNEDLWFEDLIVVTPEGKVVAVVAPEGTQCDKDEPLLSREGTYAGVFCRKEKMSNDWAYSLASTETGEVHRLDRMGGSNVAITEHGDLIYLYSNWDSPIATFWPKEDDSLRKAMGDASAPIHKDKFWKPFGKSEEILQLSDPVLAATVLGDELFTVECPDGKPIVKAYPLPNLQLAPSPHSNNQDWSQH